MNYEERIGVPTNGLWRADKRALESIAAGLGHKERLQAMIQETYQVLGQEAQAIRRSRP